MSKQDCFMFGFKDTIKRTAFILFRTANKDIDYKATVSWTVDHNEQGRGHFPENQFSAG